MLHCVNLETSQAVTLEAAISRLRYPTAKARIAFPAIVCPETLIE